MIDEEMIKALNNMSLILNKQLNIRELNLVMSGYNACIDRLVIESESGEK